MGIRFRKTKKLKDGSIITLSPSGIGYSVPVGDNMRMTFCADGSVKQTINLGNGLSIVENVGGKRKHKKGK